MLSLRNVTLGYGDKAILDVPELSLGRGEQCLIAGASGCGKTTLLYAMAGLVPVMAGEVKVADVAISALGEGERDHFRGKHIGLVFQGLHLIKSLNVLRNVRLADYAAGVATVPGKAEALLSRLGLSDKMLAMPDTLSQGQAQRVAIARAVLHAPGLLLADEPTSSLDDAACEAVVELLKDVAKEANAALVIATHDARVRAHFRNVIALGGVA